MQLISIPTDTDLRTSAERYDAETEAMVATARNAALGKAVRTTRGIWRKALVK